MAMLEDRLLLHLARERRQPVKPADIDLVEKAGDPYSWRGLNVLGFAPMEGRERLRGG